MAFFSSLLSFAIYLLPIAIVVGIGVYLAKKTQGRRKVWSKLAARYGLHFNDERAWGMINGRPTQIIRERRGEGKNKQTWTVMTSSRLPPLDLGLCIKKQGVLSSAWLNLAGGQDIELGNLAFDSAFVIKGDEPHRVRSLLSSSVCELLLEAASGGSDIYITDQGVRIEHRNDLLDIRHIEASLKTLTQVAEQIDKACANVPTATALMSYRVGWENFARAHNLSGSSTPMAMWGKLDNRAIWIYATRSDSLAYQLEVLADFPRSLGLGLVVRPACLLDGMSVWFSSQDIEVGDAVFDQFFRVQAVWPHAAVGILEANLRRRLLWLQGRYGGLSLRDEGISIRSLVMPSGPEEALCLLADAEVLADLIFENVSRMCAKHLGAYR